MNEIEKRVEEIVDNHKVLSKLQSRIVIENFPEFKKELTAYITKLLNEVVPERRNGNRTNAVQDMCDTS